PRVNASLIQSLGQGAQDRPVTTASSCLKEEAVGLQLRLGRWSIGRPTTFTRILAIQFTFILSRRHFWNLELPERRASSSSTRGALLSRKQWQKQRVSEMSRQTPDMCFCIVARPARSPSASAWIAPNFQDPSSRLSTT